MARAYARAVAVWILGAVLVAAAIGYVAWEFRWYWSTLLKASRSEDEPAEREKERELTRPL